MVSQKPTIRWADVQFIAALTKIIAARAVSKACMFAVAALLTALVLSITARAATITVNSLADTGGTPGAPNLLVNGDFSLGNTGFTSDYVFTSDTQPSGTYCIDTDPHNCDPAGASYGDHTSGTGLMLNANGAVTPNQTV